MLYPRNMRILVIGGTGFIGSHVVRQMVEAGHTVLVFHRGQTEASLPREVQHVRSGEASSSVCGFPGETLRFAPDVVVHMIAMSEEDAHAAMQTFRNHTGRIVTLSSGDVYLAYSRFTRFEPGPVEAMPLREDSPKRGMLYPYRREATSSGEMLYIEFRWLPWRINAILNPPGRPFDSATIALREVNATVFSVEVPVGPSGEATTRIATRARPSRAWGIFIPVQRDEATTGSAISGNNSSLGVSAMLVWRQKLRNADLASKAEREWICFVCFCTGF